VPAERLTVLPHPSSISLACARLGWPIESVTVVSTVGRPLAAVAAALAPGRRVIVLTSADAADIAALVADRGYGASRLVVLEQLDGPAERITEGTAGTWPQPQHDRLAVVALECALDAGRDALPLTPGRPDSAFEHDGQITKWEVRAVTLAALAPLPGQLLWDVGAGSGSVAVEWLRAHPANRAVAIEPSAERRARIERNAEQFGVVLDVVAGSAPDALAGLPTPDAIFVGGGVSVPGVLDACLGALRPGGRLVANGVTIETEVALAEAHRRHGGSLLRIALERAQPIGGFTGWTPARTVTQWSVTT
jgi:precorrin-6Y C5,15-methyltransferase (decarboxylating)